MQQSNLKKRPELSDEYPIQDAVFTDGQKSWLMFQIYLEWLSTRKMILYVSKLTFLSWKNCRLHIIVLSPIKQKTYRQRQLVSMF